MSGEAFSVPCFASFPRSAIRVGTFSMCAGKACPMLKPMLFQCAMAYVFISAMLGGIAWLAYY
jgi:hypothetical protein